MADAHADAVRLLARRPLGRRELLERLVARGHAPSDADEAVVRLEAAGVVDDLALARHWIATHARSRGRGRDRTIAELRARGVDPETAARAWAEALADGEIDEIEGVRRAVRRRLGEPPGDPGSARLARVYNALLSEGFEPDDVASALVPYGFGRTEG
jgi:regulatory protein